MHLLVWEETMVDNGQNQDSYPAEVLKIIQSWVLKAQYMYNNSSKAQEIWKRKRMERTAWMKTWGEVRWPGCDMVTVTVSTWGLWQTEWGLGNKRERRKRQRKERTIWEGCWWEREGIKECGDVEHDHGALWTRMFVSKIKLENQLFHKILQQ